jgi:hypothetical protein
LEKKYLGIELKKLSTWQLQYLKNNRKNIAKVWEESGKIKIQYTNGFTDTLQIGSNRR